jgi:hypothetical protein
MFSFAQLALASEGVTPSLYCTLVSLNAAEGCFSNPCSLPSLEQQKRCCILDGQMISIFLTVSNPDELIKCFFMIFPGAMQCGHRVVKEKHWISVLDRNQEERGTMYNISKTRQPVTLRPMK